MEAATFREALHHRGPDPTHEREGETLVKISNSWSGWIAARAAAGDMQLIVEGISVQTKPPQITTNPPPHPPVPLLGNPHPCLYFSLSSRAPCPKPLPAGWGETKPLSETASLRSAGLSAGDRCLAGTARSAQAARPLPVSAALLHSRGDSAGKRAGFALNSWDWLDRSAFSLTRRR